MSKIDEIYEEGINNISNTLDNYFNGGVLNYELTFEEIENIIEQSRIKAGNYYKDTCKMYQGYSEEEIN
jgi:hypothetical protein